MSQHDFNIANQTAAALRSDLNNALTALASLSSGATAPSTTFANMLWYDTANNILKMRTEADDGWVNIGYLDQGAGALRILDDTQVTNTSGTQIGLIGGQSTATWQAGTGTLESLVSPANVKSAIDALSKQILAAHETTSWTFTANTWEARQLTTQHNGISGASVASYNVSLPAGTYMFQGWVGATITNKQWLQARIRNTTAGTTIAASALMRLVDGDGDNGNNTAHVTGIVTLASTSDIQLQSYCTAAIGNKASGDYDGGGTQGANLIATRL